MVQLVIVCVEPSQEIPPLLLPLMVQLVIVDAEALQ
jgi:hypothetical protein